MDKVLRIMPDMQGYWLIIIIIKFKNLINSRNVYLVYNINMGIPVSVKFKMGFR